MAPRGSPGGTNAGSHSTPASRLSRCTTQVSRGGFDQAQIATSAAASRELQEQIWQLISERSRADKQLGNVSTVVPAVSEMMDAGAAIDAGVFEHRTASRARAVIRSYHFYGPAGRAFIWSRWSPPCAHCDDFRITRHARRIRDPGSRPSTERSDSRKYQSAGKLAINRARWASANSNSRSGRSSHRTIGRPIGFVP